MDMNIKYIRICSDLHLEGFSGREPAVNADKFIPADERDSESILILAGDISSLTWQLKSFIEYLSPKFAAIIYIAGNHEFYKGDINTTADSIMNHFDGINFPNVYFPGNSVQELRIAGCRFIYGTLWTDGGSTLAERALVGYSLNDFRLIKNGNHIFTVSDMVNIFKTQKAEIERLLKIPFEGKSVVITHHMPSHRLCHPRFGTDINGGFASNLEDILAYDHAPDLWIHGHTHDTIDTRLWKCRIIANPAGYRSETKASQFNTFAPLFLSLSEL